MHGQRALLTGILSAALVLLLGSGILRAQQPQLDPAKKAKALKHLRAGLKKYNEGEYQAAIDEYKKAYALYPSPKLFPNIASAHKYMGQNLKALENFEKFLKATRVDSPDRSIQRLRKEVQREIHYLLKLIGRVRVVVNVHNAVVKVAGLERGTSPMDKVFRFKPGPVNVTVKKKGYYPFDKTVNLAAGKVATVKVMLLRKIKPKVVVKVKRAPPVYKKWWFWTAIGTAVAAVAGVVTTVSVIYGTRTEEKTLSGDPRLNHNSYGIRF